MRYSLVLVGAHDGSRTEDLVRQALAVAPVILIEPVPFLFERLSARWAATPNVALRNYALSTADGHASFIAPKHTANAVAPFGDQLGSLRPGHAATHDQRFAEHVETIQIATVSFATLLAKERVTAIDLLFTDTEGMDAEILPTFPFDTLKPQRILFEFKHSDGTFRVGRKLARLLVLLDDAGYRVNVVDSENLIATLQ